MFDKTEVEYLGMFVNRDSIKVDDAKVKAIMEWPAPTTVHGVRSFLGLTNFYCRFIKDYTKLAKPLTDLTQKDKVFTWAVLQFFFLIVPSYYSFIPVVYLLGEVDAFTPIPHTFSFVPHLPFVSSIFLWT